MSLDAVRTIVAFLPRQRTRKELHNSGIGVQPGKRVSIGQLPTPKTEPAGLKLPW
jgi:hypothetical protein